jgi:hypothetical protein
MAMEDELENVFASRAKSEASAQESRQQKEAAPKRIEELEARLKERE